MTWRPGAVTQNLSSCCLRCEGLSFIPLWLAGFLQGCGEEELRLRKNACIVKLCRITCAALADHARHSKLQTALPRGCHSNGLHMYRFGLIARVRVLTPLQVWGTGVRMEILLRTLGLSNAADTMVGNAIVRGVSGGERKRVTSAEMLVGPKVLPHVPRALLNGCLWLSGTSTLVSICVALSSCCLCNKLGSHHWPSCRLCSKVKMH